MVLSLFCPLFVVFVVGLRFGLLLGRVWFCARPTCPPLFPVPMCGVGVRAGPGSRLCPALLGWVVGVLFFALFFLVWLCGVGCWLPNQGQPYVQVDAQNPWRPIQPTPPGPAPPPITTTTIRDPDLLRATLQGRAPTPPLGWYRLHEDWTEVTVKALQDLTTPSNGLHEAIVDVLLWRARKHTQGQQVWIPPIEWGQALTHDTDINVTCRGTVRLRRAPAEKDHPADTNRPEKWEQATASTRDTALCAAGLRIPDNDPPPHLQTVTTPRRRSGLQSSSADTTT